jgi:hypothetical protein
MCEKYCGGWIGIASTEKDIHPDKSWRRSILAGLRAKRRVRERFPPSKSVRFLPKKLLHRVASWCTLSSSYRSVLGRTGSYDGHAPSSPLYRPSPVHQTAIDRNTQEQVGGACGLSYGGKTLPFLLRYSQEHIDELLIAGSVHRGS